MATAAGLLAGATSAGAAAVEKGITDRPLHAGQPIFSELQALDVDFLMIGLIWRTVAPVRPADPTNPSDPAYDWGQLDRVFAAARGSGVELIPIVQGTPAWANGGQAASVPPSDPGDYADFLIAVSARYPQIERWMIWGEPSRIASWQPQGREGARLYARLLDRAYGAVTRADPGDEVIGGNTFCCGRNDAGSTSARRWLAEMRLPDGSRPRLDYWGMNPYGSRPIDIDADPVDAAFMDYNDLDTLLALLDQAYPGQRVPLFLSETGTPTGRGNTARPFFTTREEQAQRVAQLFRLAEELGRVAAVSNFLLYDQPANPDDQGRPTGWTTGLRTVEGEKKPAWEVFRRLGSDAGDVALTAQQLRINQRISQAAIRRLKAIEAALEGREPAPTGRGGPGDEILLSVGQLRINQRISQAAVRRANALEQRADAIAAGSASLGDAVVYPPPRPRGGPGGFTLSATQLLINQRISQAAVRRSNALGERLEGVLEGRGA